MGEAYKVLQWKTPLGMEEWVWHQGSLMQLSELRSLVEQSLQPLRMNTSLIGTSTALGVLVFPARRPGVSGELVMNEHLRPEFDKTREYKPFEKHVAESKWQFCNCLSCQNKRATIDALPGKPIDYNVYHHKDEKY